MSDITRPQTETEKIGEEAFVPIMTNKKKVIKEPIAAFKSKIALEEQKAHRQHLPFAWKAVEDEFKDEIERQKKDNKRLYGSERAVPLKMPNINWSKFSDLKNFEVIEEGDKHDPDLSKRHNVLVYVKKIVYKFKGYGDTYRVMEDSTDAVRRAKELAK